MSEILLFGIGTVVTLAVGAAVSLLFYAAAQEPGGDEAMRVEILRDEKGSVSTGQNLDDPAYAKARA